MAADAFLFVAGGAVQASGGIYLERDADRQLLRHCLAGDFTYVLTSRQMGKSSLMYCAAERLGQSGVRPVIVDLTELGAQTTADQWYKGFLLLVQEQLGLRESASAWWDAHADYAFAHRLIRYLREVALVERSERLVLFVDEIDTTLRLDFTDDFFAAIRFLYQNRALDPVLQRVSFVLIGVAMPNDLIKDSARTPFNIGHRIELTDFTASEAAALAGHLALPGGMGPDLIGWLLRWTGGHPYLTMRVLRSLAETPPKEWSASAIDARMDALFLGPGGETDTNLQFVRDMLTKKAFNREAVLAAYDAIRGGARVPDKELDQVTSWLKLSGIVRRQDGLLRVRNVIYERVFDQRWARVHLKLHINWRRRLTRAAVALLVLAVIVTLPLTIYAMRQRAIAEAALRQTEKQRDEANLQRANAERQLLETAKSYQLAQVAVTALQKQDPAAAAALTNQLETSRATADKDLAQLNQERERLRKERDDAQAQVQKLTQENASLKQVQPPSQDAPPAQPQQATVTVPNLIGATLDDGEQRLRSAGLLLNSTVMEGRQPRNTVLEQSPGSGRVVARGSAVLVSVSAGPAAAGPQAVSPAAPDDTQQVLRVLDRYRAAYEKLDVRAISAVYPSVNAAKLQGAFNDISRMTSYVVSLHPDGIMIAADGQSANVTVTEDMRWIGKAGKDMTIQTSVFSFRKAGGAWTILGVGPSK